MPDTTFVENLDFNDVRWLMINMIFSAVKEAAKGDKEAQAYIESDDCKSVCDDIGLDYKVIAIMKRFVRVVRGRNRTNMLDDVLACNNIVWVRKFKRWARWI